MRSNLVVLTASAALALVLAACSAPADEVAPAGASTPEPIPAADIEEPPTAETPTPEAPMVTNGDVLTGEEFSAISELPEGLEAFQIPLTGEYLIKRKGDFAGISHITEFDNPYARALFEPALGDESAMRETALAVEAHDGSLAFWMVDLGDGQYTAHSISAEFTDCIESLDLFIDHRFIHTVTYDCAEWVEEHGDVDRGRLFNAVLLDDKSNTQHRVN